MISKNFRWASFVWLIAAWGAAGQDYAGQDILEVRLEGLTRVSEQLVRSQLEVQAGQTYNQNAIARDLRRLYDMGYFQTIEADAQSQPAGVILTYIFEEKRLIERIRITGNDKIRTRQIRAALTWQEGDSFVPDAYAQELQAIRDLYQEKGFPNATVEMLASDTEPGQVRITLSISEGAKARIDDIEFAGNDVLSDRKLRRLMQTKRRWFFLGGKYDETAFESDLERIVDEYGNYGRLEAEITETEFDYSESGKQMDIAIELQEGPEYRVGALDIANNEVFDDDEILSIIEVGPGEVHNRGQVEADADLIQKGYRDSGYVNAQSEPQVTLDRSAHTTNVTHNISEDTLKYIRQLKITGNSRTKDEVIRRNVYMSPGDRFDGSSLRFSQRSLENLRYFDATRFTIEPIPDSDEWANLLLDVEEAETGEFGFGVGYNTEEGLGGFAELRLRNFDITNWPTFSGGGQHLNVRLNIGERQEQFNISFTDPEIMGYPLAFGFDVFSESHDVRGANYTEDRKGGAIRLGKSLSPYVRTRLAVRTTDLDISDVPVIAIPELRRLWRDDGSTHSIIWGIERDTLDNSQDPTDGSRYSLELELAGLGDHEFYKIETDTSWYHALTGDQKWVASERLRLGWVNDYGDPGFVSLVDRFHAGGSSTVRGYSSRDIGPELHRFGFFGEDYRVGGEMRIVNNVELKYKLTERVRIYSFVDAGGVWSEASDFDFGDMRFSAGIGFGLDVPRLGPVRIDYGVPLNPDEDQGSGRLHFVTGFRF